ncbi:MAG: DUF4838 domain-containing protein [Clostridia bacterium]|nr:DUF4838 domain-containing protein [Clostridia bacterium]
MKKTHLTAVILFTALMCILFAVCASAHWWEDNPFSDVASDSWYYDAVRITKNNNMLSGVSDTEFGSNTPMTRAMFVTALASGMKYDPSAYNASPFDDVPEGKWYTAAVAWALDHDIASGTAVNTFSPDQIVTRQQLVVMLHKYADLIGYEYTPGDTTLETFPDADEIAEWACDDFIWAYEKGVISGTNVDGQVYLKPGDPATRAQVAVMLTKLLYLDPTYAVNGNDISLYKIVYAEGADSHYDMDEVAELMRDSIKTATGVELEITTDETEPTDFEILLGKTNREDARLVTVDRDSFPDDNYYIWSVQGSRLVIAGIDSDSHDDAGDRSTMNIGGTKKAVISFSEEILGIEFYEKDCITADTDPVINLPDGYSHIGKSSFKWHTEIVDGWGIGDCGHYYSEWGCGSPHRIRQVMFGLWDDPDFSFNARNPCFTDPDNIDSLIKNTRYLLDTHPTKNLVGLILSDSDGYCTCENCMKIYRETGSRSGTLIRMLKILADALKDDYPNVKYATWAYTFAIVPPKNIEKNDKLVIYFNTLVYCAVHPYSDSSCPLNAKAEEYISRWCDISAELNVWEHTGSFRSYLTPYGNLDIILENARFFLKHGATGMFLNGTSLSDGTAYPDFNIMRGYLFDRVYRNAEMSDGEYNYHINGFLKAYYGDSWRYLREYMDIMNSLEKSKHHVSHFKPGGAFDFDEVRANIEKLDSLWEKIESIEASEEQRFRIENEKISWLYIRQCALYESMSLTGTPAERSEYMKYCEELYNIILKHDMPKVISGSVQFDGSPEDWQGWTDDY